MPRANKDERKTRLKTIRLSESLARSLEKEAADEGTTVNADINSILSKHFRWDKKAEEFGFFPLHKPILISLIEQLDDKTLARIGREVLAASWKEMAEFFLQDSSLNGFLGVLNMTSRFDPKMRVRVTQKEDTYTIVFHHDFGLKWSIVAASIVAANAAQEVLKQSFHVEQKMSQGESVVTARFKVNPRNSPITLPPQP